MDPLAGVHNTGKSPLNATFREHMTQERTARITLPPNLDVYNSDAVAQMLPDPTSVDRVVVDCSAADAIDSTIITVLLRYRRKFIAAGKDPVELVIIASPGGRRSLDITGMSRALTVLTATPKESRADPNPEETSTAE